MKRGTAQNPKARHLARLLEIEYPWGPVGILSMLWDFTASHAPAGDVGRWSDEEIGEAIGWRADAGGVKALVEALVVSGWLDRCECPHRLIVHDWPDHAEEAVRKKLRRAVAVRDGIPFPEAVPDWARPCRDGVETTSRHVETTTPTPTPTPTPRERRTSSRRPATKAPGLSEQRIDLEAEFYVELATLCPQNISAGEVAVWLEMMVPRMRDKGRKDLKRTARAWVVRMKKSEADQATRVHVERRMAASDEEPDPAAGVEPPAEFANLDADNEEEFEIG